MSEEFEEEFEGEEFEEESDEGEEGEGEEIEEEGENGGRKTKAELQEELKNHFILGVDLRNLTEYLLINGQGKGNQYVIVNGDTSLDKSQLNAIQKSYDAKSTKFLKAMKRAKRSNNGTKKPILKYISVDFVEFLRNLNFGNGYSLALGKGYPQNKTFKNLTPADKAEIEESARRARLNGHNKTEKAEIQKLLTGKESSAIKENYETNLKALGLPGNRTIDPSLIDIQANLKLLFERNISTVDHLMRLIYLYIRVNNLANPNEGVRFRLEKSFSDFIDEPYSWRYDDIQFMGDEVDTKGNIVIPKDYAELSLPDKSLFSERVSELSAGTIRELIQRSIGKNSDKPGFKKDRNGKYKEFVNENGLINEKIMEFLNNWAIPNVVIEKAVQLKTIPDNALSLLEDPEILNRYTIENLYLDEVFQGVKKSDKLREEEKKALAATKK